MLTPFNLEFGIGVCIAMVMRGRFGLIEWKWQLPSLFIASLLTRGVIKTLNLEIRMLELIMWMISFFVITMLIAICTRPTSESAIIKFIGDASYSIFLSHVIFITPIIKFFRIRHHWMPTSHAAVLAIIISAFTCCMAYVLVEKRLTSWLSAKLLC